MNGSFEKSPDDVLYSDISHGWKTTIVTVNEVAKTLPINLIPNEVGTQTENQKDPKDQNRECEEYFIGELEGKGHSNLLEDEISEES